MSKDNGRGLNPKQARFVEEYVLDMNATQAATRAGYSAKTAASQGHELLKKPQIVDAIAKHRARGAMEAEITFDLIVAELAALGFSNMGDYLRPGQDGDVCLDFSDLSRAQTAALTSVTSEVYLDGVGPLAERVKRTTFKLADKRMALMDLAKLLGYTLPAQLDVNVHGGVAVVEFTAAQLKERALQIAANTVEGMVE